MDDGEYEKNYPSSSSVAKIYGSPKMHKVFDSNSLPNFLPIVSSIGTYNYNLSKYLCENLSFRYVHICGGAKGSKYKW